MISAYAAAIDRIRRPWAIVAAAQWGQRSGLILDLVERCLTVVLLSSFTLGLIGAAFAKFNFVLLLIVVSEAIPVALMVTRRFAKDVSRIPSDWVLGFAGTATPLFAVAAPAAPIIPIGICVVVLLAGLLLQISAKVILGRSFGIVAANRGIKRDGPYRAIRHPMYAGYTLVHFGFLLACPSLVNLVLYCAAFTIQVARLLREEDILVRDQQYAEYAAAVRYRLLPGVF